jgi:broad specificity phosphatase PhoE
MKKLLVFFTILLITTFCCADTTVLLFRHGQTDANRYGIVQGHLDYPLNEKGIEQAKALAEKIRLKHPDIVAIYSSDLERAHQTAQETANALWLPIQKKALLKEIHYGIAEGMCFEEFFSEYTVSFEELNRKYPTRKERWDHTNIPKSETTNQLLERIKEELTRIAEHHPDEKIAVFSHGTAICTFLTDLLGSSQEYPKLSNCDGAIVIYKEGAFTFLKGENLLIDP